MLALASKRFVNPNSFIQNIVRNSAPTITQIANLNTGSVLGGSKVLDAHLRQSVGVMAFSTIRDPWSLTNLGPLPPGLKTTREQHRASYQAESILTYAAQEGLPVYRFHLYSPERKIFQASLALTMLLCEVKDIKEEGVLSLGKNFRQVHDAIWHKIQPHILPLIAKQENSYRSIQAEVRAAFKAAASISDYDAGSGQFSVLKGADLDKFMENCTRQARFVRGILVKVTREVDAIQLDVTKLPDMLAALVYNDPSAVDSLVMHALASIVKEAAVKLGIPLIQSKDVMEVTTLAAGAPTSGKSTARHRFEDYMLRKMDLKWTDAAKIDADVFRRALLADLSPKDQIHHASLTNCEATTILGMMTPYLILSNQKPNALHFDNFYMTHGTLSSLVKKSKRLLLSFFFVPPEETVKRNLVRGQRIGRYMDVPSLLDKYKRTNQDFFPLIFKMKGERFRFELLNKDIPEGSAPILVAYGNLEKDRVTIYHVKELMKLTQYGKINPEATSEKGLYLIEKDKQPAENIEGVLQVVDTFGQIDFAVLNADSKRKESYACVISTDGKKIFEILNPELYSRQLQCDWNSTLFSALQVQLKQTKAIH